MDIKIKLSLTPEATKAIGDSPSTVDWLNKVERMIQIEAEHLLSRYALLGSIQIHATKKGGK